MKTVESLINPNKKVYIRMKNDEICKAFFTQAEREGFIFGDGAKPTKKHTSDFIAVLPDKSLCYVNTYGRIAMQSGAENIIVYDYEKVLPIELDFQKHLWYLVELTKEVQHGYHQRNILRQHTSV